MTCECEAPGFCKVHDRFVDRHGIAVCRRGIPARTAKYFGADCQSKGPRTVKAKPEPRGECAFLGESVRKADGRALTRKCGPCGDKKDWKVFKCHAPELASDPTTTAPFCQTCKHWKPKEEPDPLPVQMVAPRDKRPGIHHGGILQIHVTRACDLACYHCTQGSNLAGRPVSMTVEQFEEACDSLADYFGVVGMFGGNPCVHPKFDELCTVMKRVPWERRGLWTNNLMGKGAIARQTFNPAVSNFNVHLSEAAAKEFEADWPEAVPFLKGRTEDSRHGAPFVAMKDVIADEAERWKLIGACDINKLWSAMICVVRGELRGFFCELAGAQAMLHADNPDWDGTGKPMPDTGVPITPGWWNHGMAAFANQARLHCHSCGIPLRGHVENAIGGEAEHVSTTHIPIASPKKRGRKVELVTLPVLPSMSHATEYLPGTHRYE